MTKTIPPNILEVLKAARCDGNKLRRERHEHPHADAYDTEISFTPVKPQKRTNQNEAQ